MIYKVVPAAMVVTGSTYSVAEYFQDIINKEAKNGWQFYSMETATAEENKGCSFNGPAVERTTTYLLIFCKDANDVPAAAPSTGAARSIPKPVNGAIFCINCGSKLKENASFCPECGTRR
jgi:hypothetical protein